MPVIRNATALLVNVSVALNAAIIAIVPLASFALKMTALRFVNASTVIPCKYCNCSTGECMTCLHYLAILTTTHVAMDGSYYCNCVKGYYFHDQICESIYDECVLNQDADAL